MLVKFDYKWMWKEHFMSKSYLASVSLDCSCHHAWWCCLIIVFSLLIFAACKIFSNCIIDNLKKKLNFPWLESASTNKSGFTSQLWSQFTARTLQLTEDKRKNKTDFCLSSQICNPFICVRMSSDDRITFGSDKPMFCNGLPELEVFWLEEWLLICKRSVMSNKTYLNISEALDRDVNACYLCGLPEDSW